MPYGIPKNNSCSASNTNSLQSSTENEADTAANVPSTTSNERPVSLELQLALPAQEPAQVSVPLSNMDQFHFFVFCLSVLQHFAVLQCITGFW